MLSAVRGCKPSLETHRVSTFGWGRSCSEFHMCFNMVPVYGKRKVGRHEVLCSQPWTSLLCKELGFPDSVRSLSHCLRTGNPQASDPPASPTTFVFWQGSRRVGRIGEQISPKLLPLYSPKLGSKDWVGVPARSLSAGALAPTLCTLSLSCPV